MESQGEFGPFIPNVPVKVPLFIAMAVLMNVGMYWFWLNSGDCEAAPFVSCYSWLLTCDTCAGALRDVLDREREMADQASDLAEVGMPFHYNAIAHKLLEL